MKINIKSHIRKFLSDKIKLFEQDRTVNVHDKIKKLVAKKLKEVVDQLEEEFGMMFFGKRIRLKGRNIKKDKMMKSEGIVSEVNVYVTKNMEVQLKVKFKDAGKVYEDINYITVLDTMPSKKRQSNSPIYHI